MHVRYIASFNSAKVFNLASPRYILEIARKWPGKLPFWTPKYEPARDLMESMYVDAFNEASGHYKLLEDDVKANGFRNPIMVSAGRLQRRAELDLPPHLRGKRNFVCEYVGGSRLWVAQRLKLPVPVLVNDFAGMVNDGVGELIPTRNEAAVRALFPDAPRKLSWNADGSLYVNYLAFSHFPVKERQQRQQQQIRQREKIVEKIAAEVRKWCKEND